MIEFINQRVSAVSLGFRGAGVVYRGDVTASRWEEDNTEKGERAGNQIEWQGGAVPSVSFVSSARLTDRHDFWLLKEDQLTKSVSQ